MPDGTATCPGCGQPAGPPPLPLGMPPAPAAKGPSKAIWVIVGCAAVPVLIAILGIIAAIIIPNFLDALQRARQKRAMSDLRTIGQAVETYRADHGDAPRASGVDALAAELGGSASLPRVDPWKHPYRYGCVQEESASECAHYRIVSAGRDGRFEQDDLAAYEPGKFEAREYDRDIVFGDGSLLVLPATR